MDLSEFLKSVVRTLQDESVRYALAGGLITSIYRKEKRMTDDLDFLILAQKESEKIAVKILKRFGLAPEIIRKADLEGGPKFAIKRKSTPPYIVAGRTRGNLDKIRVDFILPQMPWFESALPRAEQNLINFGFGKIPCLTVEDIILSKFYSLYNDSTRFNDMDDLKSIFAALGDLDLSYISGQMQKLKLILPLSIIKIVPHTLKLISKRIKRGLNYKK